MIAVSEFLRRIAKELKAKYSFFSTQIDLPDGIGEKLKTWVDKNIPDKAFYEKEGDEGRENDPHITVLYGIKSSDPKKVKEVLKKYKPFKVRLGLVTSFKDNKEYDVLKIDIEASDIQKMHYDIEKHVDNDNSYPTYAPHATLGYLKKGFVDNYIGDETFRGVEFLADVVSFCDHDGKKIKIHL